MKRYKKPILAALFAAYLLVLLRITVFRTGCFSHGWCSGRVEWIPFVYLAELARRGDWGYFCYLFFGNLLWFVPLGWALGALRLRLRQAALLGLGLSFLIELGQFLLGSGVSEVEDLILNTAGTVLGWLITYKKLQLTSDK